MDLMLIRATASVFDLVKVFLAMEKGEHLKYDAVEVWRVSELILEPDMREGQHVDTDVSGALYPAAPLHCVPHPGIARILF